MYRRTQVLGEIVGEWLLEAENHFLMAFCLEAPGRAGELTKS